MFGKKSRQCLIKPSFYQNYVLLDFGKNTAQIKRTLCEVIPNPIHVKTLEAIKSVDSTLRIDPLSEIIY